jgi:hypothetical protein
VRPKVGGDTLGNQITPGAGDSDSDDYILSGLAANKALEDGIG